MQACISDVAVWMMSNQLQLNATKTEALWCAPLRQLNQVTRRATSHWLRRDSVSALCSRLRYIHRHRSNHKYPHVASCFAALQQLCSIQRSVSRPVLLSLVTSLVLSSLDYESATLAGIRKYLLDRLQSVHNAAARLICRACKYEHVSPLLQELH